MSFDAIGLLGIAEALAVIWQARRALGRGGSFYDREIYGLRPAAHRRASRAAWIVAAALFAAGWVPGLPLTPLVAAETLAVILYLASFARGASHEDE